ncbi:hypothetical protein PCASD_01017 [Puccinia coronata f. sp. avenae]|uniref:Uncharacterized protein n=1 Tax=Puccinia coronata f. sp. avenae TaxID=200324 RepID=A0A2N5VML6_9BASI|nr:hypothetical protein PCASD_01017 [Puccinia coronata f. sp. avenae]
MVPAQRTGVPACRAFTSPAERRACSPSCYQPSGQVYLLAQLVSAQRAGVPARRAGKSPAGRCTCLTSWYQPSWQVYLLAELVPAQRAGVPARRAGTSPAGRCTCSPGWYQPSGQVYLLAELVPTQRAGVPARRADTGSGGRPGVQVFRETDFLRQADGVSCKKGTRKQDNQESKPVNKCCSSFANFITSCGSPGVAAGATEIRLDALAVWQRQWRVGLIAATVLVSRVDAQTPFLMTPALEIGDDNYVFLVVINSEWRLVTVASN